MKMKCSAGGLGLLLLVALQPILVNGNAQEIGAYNKSWKNTSAATANSDTNITLRDAILQIKKTWKVDILFDDAIVSGMMVSTAANWSRSANAEEALASLLKDTQLNFKTVKKDTYIIIADTAKTRQGKDHSSNKKEANTPENTGTPLNEKEAITNSDSKNARAVLIKGIVVDQNDKPLSGVSVIVKGTKKGTTTNAAGRFAIEADNDKDVLEFSYVGYEPQELAVTQNTSELKIVMKDLNNRLGDVVVIGYGTAKRKDLTGSVASIGVKEIRSQPINSFNQALQGRVSGVQITQSSNSPGGGITVRVRGGNSISASNDPLYVIDGFPVAIPTAPTGAANSGVNYANPLSTINPNDIESIEVLKDASATAIYGSRGANGVVLVTTRKGKSGQVNIEFETFAGLQKVTKTLPMGNAMDHLNLKNEQLTNLGFPIRFGNPTGPYPKPVTEYGEGTNWQKEIFRTAPLQNYQLSITGGNDKIRYLISGNYYNQDGIVIENNFKRYSARLNLDANLNERLKVGSNFTVARTINNGVNETGSGSPVFAALTISPASPVYDPNGAFQLLNFGPGSGYFSIANPVAVQKTSVFMLTSNRILGNVFGEYTIAEGLKARVSVGADILDTRKNAFLTPQTLLGNTRNGYGSNGTSDNLNLLNENTLTYSKKINEDHSFDLLAGITFQSNREERTYQEAEDFPNYTLKSNNLSAANKLVATNSNLEKWGLNSYLARVNYRYKDRYLFTFSAREDGSSRFGKNNKYGFFPSGAFAWRVSDEAFLKNNKYISDLKLRASYGITGNDGIGLYNSLSRYILGRTVFNDVEVLTNQIARIENPDLRWEKTQQLDIGLDVGFFDNRLNIVADFYRKVTSDLLLNVELPSTTGATSVLRNIGSVENKGFELAINSINIEHGGKGLRWTTNGNISFNKNKVIALQNGVDKYFTSNGSGVNFAVQIGKPLGSFYGNVFDGIWQTKEEITNAGPLALAGDLPGAPRWKDVNNDKKYTESDDRTILGNGLPTFIFGLTNNFSYRDFDLSFFFQGVQGNKIYNMLHYYNDGSDPQYNASKNFIDHHWTSSNASNSFPSVRQWRLPATSNYAIEDGSFIRLKTISLGYQLPISVKGISKARVYASAQNLFTITDYSGYDPEVNGDFNSNTSYGVDFFNYPPARTYLLGLSITF